MCFAIVNYIQIELIIYPPHWFSWPENVIDGKSAKQRILVKPKDFVGSSATWCSETFYA